MSGPNGMRYNFAPTENMESPLFERQVGGDDFVEMHQLRVMIDNQQQAILNLEKINMDLEIRLEEQAKTSMAVEKECTLIEQHWKAKNKEVKKEIESWKTAFQQEKMKGDRLREQVQRTERELYGILQRKYELIRGPGTNKGMTHSKLPSNSDLSSLKKGGRHDNESSSSSKVRLSCYFF
jgi:predicted RNase H-like nuclease (RuvC/YqgF family)